MNKNTATLLISAPDRKGLVATIANFLLSHNANIVHADQHQDTEANLFLMRVEWDMTDFSPTKEVFQAAFSPIAEQYQMQWNLRFSAQPLRMAIMVSQYEHCLSDLLHRYRIGELECEIPLIISNHENCRALAEFNDIPFYHTPMVKEKKAEIEAYQLKLLEEHQIDLVVMARYMQILSPNFIATYPNRIINIHHSFLPAFDGAKPYHRAHARGVKLIGATAHYATSDLDEGPIIEQEVMRISHRDSVEDLIKKGRDLEKIVLSRAVRWHLDSRILSYQNRTVVFD